MSLQHKGEEKASEWSHMTAFCFVSLKKIQAFSSETNILTLMTTKYIIYTCYYSMTDKLHVTLYWELVFDRAVILLSQNYNQRPDLEQRFMECISIRIERPVNCILFINNVKKYAQIDEYV